MIKNIYCLGTSHTAGGGFHEKEKVQSIYQDIVESPSQSTLSWPGILETFTKNINIHNLAESGAGNERVYRLVFDILTSKNFNKEENLFLIEVSFLDRKEFWSNTIKDFVICNYTAARSENNVQVVRKYYEPELHKPIPQKLYYDFLQETVDFHHLLNKLQFNLLTFFTFLTHFGINYKIIYNRDIFSPNQQKYNIFESLKYNINGVITDDWYGEADRCGYLIDNETSNMILDFHQGYFINNIVARTIYNSLIDDMYITGNKLEIENTEADFLKLKAKINLKRKLI